MLLMALRLTHCFIARIPGRFSSSLASTTAYKDLLEETAVARRLEQISGEKGHGWSAHITT